MIKSISSVFENSIIADSTLGHAFNVGPYIEPAGNMVFARNIFANLTGQGDYSAGDAASMQNVAHSGGWVVGQAGRPAADYNFTENTDPKLSDPVIKEWDNNLFFGVEGHSLDQLKPYGWDMHAVEADPLFQRLSGNNTWNRTCADYALAADSPAWALGFRRMPSRKSASVPTFHGHTGRQRSAESMRYTRRCRQSGTHGCVDCGAWEAPVWLPVLVGVPAH